MVQSKYQKELVGKEHQVGKVEHCRPLVDLVDLVGRELLEDKVDRYTTRGQVEGKEHLEGMEDQVGRKLQVGKVEDCKILEDPVGKERLEDTVGLVGKELQEGRECHSKAQEDLGSCLHTIVVVRRSRRWCGRRVMQPCPWKKQQCR